MIITTEKEGRDFENMSFESNLSSLAITEELLYINTAASSNGEVGSSTEYNNASEQDNLLGWNDFGGTIGFGIPDSADAIAVANYCFGFILILIGLAGSSGNALVLYVFTRYRKLRGGARPLVLSLASGDLVMSVLHIMPAISSFHQKWAFGSLGCSLYAAIVGLCGIASLLTLAAIAANRFSIIVGRPQYWLDGIKSCLFIWMVSGSLTFPPFFGWSKYGTEGLGTSCAWDYLSRDFYNRLYYIFLLSMGFVLPVSTIIISYTGILFIVCRQSSRMVMMETGSTSKAKKPTTNDFKTAKVTFTIIICFLTAWTPYAIVSMIGQFGDEKIRVSPLGTALPAIFAKTSVVFNPIVYGLSHPNFRAALRRLRAQQSRKKYRITNTGNNQNTGMNLNTGMNNLHTPQHHQLCPDYNANKYSNQFGCGEKGTHFDPFIASAKSESPVSGIPKPYDSVKAYSQPLENISGNIKLSVDDPSVLPRSLLFFVKSSIELGEVGNGIEKGKRVSDKIPYSPEHPESFRAVYLSQAVTGPKHGYFRRAYSFIGGRREDSKNLQKFLSLSENCLDIHVAIDDCHRPGHELMDPLRISSGMGNQLRPDTNEINQAQNFIKIYADDKV